MLAAPVQRAATPARPDRETVRTKPAPTRAMPARDRAMTRVIERATPDTPAPTPHWNARYAVDLPPPRREIRPPSIPAPPAPTLAGGRTGGLSSGVQRKAAEVQSSQTQVEVGAPDSPHEHEAEAVAQTVVERAGQDVQPSVQRQQDQKLSKAPLTQRQPAGDEKLQTLAASPKPEKESEPPMAQCQEAGQRPLQRESTPEKKQAQTQAKAAAPGARRNVPPPALATLRNPGAGQPLPRAVRSRIEPHLGADLSGVRVHGGPGAQRAATSLNARAFTHGRDVFLGRSESSSDLRLMAHESTHVVQQGAAQVQGAPLERAPIRPSAAGPKVQRSLIPGFVLEEINDYARYIPGFTLFTVILGWNPLLGEEVDRNATNLLAGFMGLVPFGTFIFDKLVEHGILESAFQWVETELDRLDLSIGRIEDTINNAWEDMDLLEGFDFNLAVLERHFAALYNDVESFALSLVSQILQLIKEAAIGVAESLLADNQAWALIKKVLHFDPLRNQAVEASTVEILEDFLTLIGKQTELEQMRERGTLEKTAAWLDTQLITFLSLLGQYVGLFSAAWEAIQPANLPELGTNLQNLVAQAISFLQGVWDFALTVAATVLQLIKDALLGLLQSFASDVPGYHLLTLLLEHDLFTQEPVARTPTNLIRGFMSLMPGGERQFQQMQQSGVIPAAAQRIESALTDLGISWTFVQELFLGIWNTLSIEDLVDPIPAFQRIVDQFAEPISRLFAFVVEVVKVILELVLALMGFPSDILARIIQNALRAIEDIARDPIAFLKNMIGAMRLGFSKFFENILTHLLNGVVDWLFGGLSEAGIQPPKDLSLGSILDLVFQILGLSIERLWQKLADKIGQEKVDKLRGAIDRLTGIWTFVRDVQERGIAAIWEYIESQISNLWSIILEKARNWIVTKVIEQVTVKLLSFLDPTGIMAVINGCIAFFKAVESAIRYFREMLLIVDDYVSTLASVARGAVEPGANKLEQGLARAIPVAIGFLANQVGLGNVAEKIREIVEAVRETIDGALDWLLDQAMRLGAAVLNTLGLGGAAETEQPKPPGQAKTGDGEVGKTVTFGEHHLWYNVQGTTVRVMVASEIPAWVGAKLTEWEGLSVYLGDQKAEADALIQRARDQLAAAQQQGQEAATEKQDAEQHPQDTAKSQEFSEADGEAEESEENLGTILDQLFKLFGEKKSEVGALGLYRGIHFFSDFSEEEYDRRLTEDLVGQPTFAAAAREIAGSDDPGDLQAAAELVKNELKRTESITGARKYWGRQYRTFENEYFAILSRYVNAYQQFRIELQDVASGRYGGLLFTRIPFISTSKIASQAARFALNPQSATRPRRTDGVVGRLFVYIFTLSELRKLGAIDIQRLEREGKIYVSSRIIGQGEVLFAGSVPGENQVAQIDATATDSDAGLGAQAEQVAETRAQSAGGLRSWEN